MERCSKIDNFCYVCGKYMIKHHHESEQEHQKRKSQKNIESPEFVQQYTNYFNEINMIREDFTPNYLCHTCHNNLRLWWHGSLKKFRYLTPMIWTKDPLGHKDDRCNACTNYNEGRGEEKKSIQVHFYWTASYTIP